MSQRSATSAIAIGLGLFLSSVLVDECSADWFGFCHPHMAHYSHSWTRTSGGVPFTPMMSSSMVTPSNAATGQPTTFAAPPRLPDGSTGPVAPISPSATSGIPRIFSTVEHLFAFDPRNPASPLRPAGASADQVNTSHSLGNRILQQLEGALLNDPSGQMNPVQAAINIFGNETGFSPIAKDVEVLTSAALQVAQTVKAKRAGGAAPAPTPAPVLAPAPAPAAGDAVPAAGAGVTTITFTITVQGPAQVKVGTPTVTPPTPAGTTPVTPPPAGGVLGPASAPVAPPPPPPPAAD